MRALPEIATPAGMEPHRVGLSWLRDAAAQALAMPPVWGSDATRLLDLRPRPDFVRAHFPGACRLAPEEIDRPFLRPPRRRSVVCLGARAEDAEAAALRLRALGHDAWALDAPLSAWPGPWESGEETAPAWEASPLAARWASRVAGLRVLDLACGSGRDAVAFALHGARVTAIDRLPDALAQAAEIAARHNVEITLHEADVENDPGSWEGSWDAIHVNRFLDRPSLPLLGRRLAPGGCLLVSTFLEEQARSGRKPRSAAHLLRPGELLEAGRGLNVLEYRESLTGEGNWIASLVARRPDGDTEPGRKK